MTRVDPKLTEQSSLFRAPELQLQLRPDGSGLVANRTETLHCGPDLLTILQAFARPTRLGEAMTRLTQDCGQTRWIEITAAIRRMVKAGILLRSDSDRAATTGTLTGHELAMHVSLLDDEARTLAYVEAIERTVRPDDVVLDLGTGTGILALAAARAGAARVYAVEASQMADVAEAVFQASGFGDRIVLLRGWSHHLKAPELADVLVSEILGHDPLSEGVLGYMDDAARRWLKPSARCIPKRLSVLAVPVECPPDFSGLGAPDGARVDHWKRLYGFDFSPLVDYLGITSKRVLLSSAEARRLRRLGPAITLAQFDLAQTSRRAVDRRSTGTYSESGRVDGMLMLFELDLGAGRRHRIEPDAHSAPSSWQYLLYRSPERPEARPGADFTVEFTACPSGNSSQIQGPFGFADNRSQSGRPQLSGQE